MLTGILVPSSGEVDVAGMVPHKERMQLARRIGVVFGQKSQLWWDVPVLESLRLLKEIYKIPDETYNANLEIYNDLLDLHEFKDTPVRQLSLGQRMRSDLAAALLHNPEILFLDEPTIGVDVVAKERFRSFIRALNREREVTILLTTHDMSDIEKVCPRLMIIDQGRVIYDGSVSAIKEQYSPFRVLVVDFSDEVPEGELDQADLVALEGRTARYRFNRHEVSASELIVELAGRYAVKDISVEEADIKSIVREIYIHSAETQGSEDRSVGVPAVEQKSQET